ncbi:hypothetical protein J5N97_018104 [Dioscorea zingiberensis]|uniref:Protein kinase domain-containing protein n=1 Tax=Dioscorea zingiberensis TaxID=325984 RepID=A0A9D5CN72_9LILI|nr:hypothetical protein J5N97_018104 [Dioscorea zingiberensis]
MHTARPGTFKQHAMSGTRLHMDPINKKHREFFTSPPVDTSSNKMFHLNPIVSVSAIIMVASAFIFFACLIVTVFVFCMKNKQDRMKLKDCTITLFGHEIKSAKDLSFVASTGGVGLEIIGRGGCGDVYKAHLPRRRGENLTVAIKKITLTSPMSSSQFYQERSSCLSDKMRQVRAEIKTVGHVGHPNLVRLLAHVSKGEHHFLVSEFMQNGSLHDALKKCQLDWPARYKIALGIISGLQFLHFIHKPCIIHRDLKPGNILLDSDLNPKIADFGLAKVVEGRFVRTRLAGTLGYIAPENYNGMPCTDKCDVYSFGVILAVLVTGRFPNDDRVLEEMGMVKWVRRVMSSGDEAAIGIIDEKMVGNGYEEQMVLVLKIACFCMYDNPRERPRSRDLKCMLAQIKH